jgi:NADPH:quinone reductase-like Zn-dependent oxidoreductase
MKAMVQEAYGPPAIVMRARDVDRPNPGEGEVLLRVHAAGVDAGVGHIVRGLPYLVRIAGFGVRRPKEQVRAEVAGTVEAAGPGVTAFQRGDEVFGVAREGFAEYACARVDKVAVKPANVSFEEAAVTPVSAMTALEAVRDVAKVAPGQTVLIIGAAGGVGTYAVQIAKALGGRVTGVCSTAKIEHVRSAGAEYVIDYTREDFAGGRKYDVVLDIAGNRPLSELRRALAPAGTLVIVGGEGGGRVLGGISRQAMAIATSPFSRQNLRTFISGEKHEDLLTVKQMLEEGTLRPVIDRSFALDEVPEAIRHLAEGRARGKVVIQLNGANGR